MWSAWSILLLILAFAMPAVVTGLRLEPPLGQTGLKWTAVTPPLPTLPDSL